MPVATHGFSGVSCCQSDAQVTLANSGFGTPPRSYGVLRAERGTRCGGGYRMAEWHFKIVGEPCPWTAQMRNAARSPAFQRMQA